MWDNLRQGADTDQDGQVNEFLSNIKFTVVVLVFYLNYILKI